MKFYFSSRGKTLIDRQENLTSFVQVRQVFDFLSINFRAAEAMSFFETLLLADVPQEINSGGSAFPVDWGGIQLTHNLLPARLIILKE